MLFNQNRFSKKNKKLYENKCKGCRNNEYIDEEEEYEFKTQRF